jgi:cobalamin synthase
VSQFTRTYAEEELLAVFGDEAAALSADQLSRVVAGVIEVAKLRDVSVMLAVELLRRGLHPQTLADYADAQIERTRP